MEFDDELRELSKYHPADVSAIGVSILIDHIEELEKTLLEISYLCFQQLTVDKRRGIALVITRETLKESGK